MGTAKGLFFKVSFCVTSDIFKVILMTGVQEKKGISRAHQVKVDLSTMNEWDK